MAFRSDKGAGDITSWDAMTQTTFDHVRRAAELELAATGKHKNQRLLGTAQRVPSADSHTSTFALESPAEDLGSGVEAHVEFQPAGSSDWYATEVLSADLKRLTIRTIRVASDCDHGDLRLVRDDSLVPKALVEYLRSNPPPRQAAPLLKGGSLASLPEDPPSDPSLNDLNHNQKRALAAIVGPGTSLVWGPPGTGKTRVIGSAIAWLVRQPRSVAIVSNTNIAVDNAIMAATERLGEFQAGEVIRIGNCGSEVQGHPLLPLQRAVEAKQKPAREALDAVVQKLNQLDDRARQPQEQMPLATWTDESLRALDGLMAEQARYVQAAQQGRELASRLESAEQALARTRSLLRASEQRKRKVESYLDLPDLIRDLEVHELQMQHIVIELEQAEQALRSANDAPIFGRRKRRREAEERLSKLRRERESIKASYQQIESRREGAAKEGITAALVEEILEQYEAAVREWGEQRSVAQNTMALQADFEARFNALRKPRPMTSSERDTWAELTALGGLDMVLRRRREMRADHERIDKRRDELSKKRDALQSKLDQVAHDTIGDAQVVATTLAQLLTNHALVARTFDVVIVDEASAATAPMIYAALTKARFGAALVGDFQQNGPISALGDTLDDKDDEPAMLARSSIFECIGIDDPNTAEAHPACAVLTEQYRFGATSNAVINKVAYNDLLRVADDSGNEEIVVLDTSGLPSIYDVVRDRQSGCTWLAGALTAAAAVRVAELRQARIAIVTPYRIQENFIRALLKDRGLPIPPIGTAHRFQGQEFDWVLFDLVEGAQRANWFANANWRGNSWQRAGARLATVGLTRHRSKLMIVGDCRRLRTYAPEGPAGVLMDFVARDQIGLVPAQRLLNYALPEFRVNRSAVQIQGGVPLARDSPMMLLDQSNYYESLQMDLESARHSVLIVSPFVWQRVNDLLPILNGKVSDGIRVLALIRPDRKRSNRFHDLLKRSSVQVREVPGLHEKVVVIDEHIVYQGSLNTLSHDGTKTELMFRHEGTYMAKELLNRFRSSRG